jgi:hypothetical protein
VLGWSMLDMTISLSVADKLAVVGVCDNGA